jgi:hypothetical protein
MALKMIYFYLAHHGDVAERKKLAASFLFYLWPFMVFEVPAVQRA